MIDYKKCEYDELVRYKQTNTERISLLMSSLDRIYELEKSAAEVFSKLGDRLVMDGDFGRVITEMSAELGDCVYQNSLIDKEMGSRLVFTVNSGNSGFTSTLEFKNGFWGYNNWGGNV